VRDLAGYHLSPLPYKVKVNQNENPYDLPAEVKREILAQFAGEAWSRYPPFVPEALHQALGEHYGFGADWVLAGNGSNEVLYATLAVTLGQGDHVVVPVPTFSLYGLLARVLGATVHSMAPARDLAPDVEGILRIARDTRAKVVFLCSPNNPTGRLYRSDEVDAIVAGAPGLVVLDEAYVEFASVSYTERVRAHENLVVLRTFSKALGLAGLRIGCLLAHPPLVREIAKGKLPYNISSFTSLACQVALRRIDAIRPAVDRLKDERARLAVALSGLDDLSVHPSEANFLLVRVDAPLVRVFEGLVARGVLVRDVSGYPHLEGHLRVTVGTPDENDMVVAAFGASLAEARKA
jgi:histidinol-phosphate aminotransferase